MPQPQDYDEEAEKTAMAALMVLMKMIELTAAVAGKAVTRLVLDKMLENDLKAPLGT